MSFVNDLSMLNQLANDWGFENVDKMLEATVFDAVAPGICECGYSTEVEPDCQDGWCEECEAGTVKSCCILAGIM